MNQNLPDNATAPRSVDQQQACYALRLYTYDYYEWQEDIAVSFDQGALKAHLEQLDHLYDDQPLVDASEHESYADGERVHWVITPVLFLHNKVL